MGFWDTIIQGGAEIASWGLKNAGSIVEFGSAIAKVIGVTAEFDAEGDGDGNMLVKLSNDVFTAHSQLEILAKDDKDLKPPEVDHPHATVSGPFDLPALWPSPPSAHTTVPPIISADIDKFLTLNGIPTSRGTGLNETDVGRSIAQQMFSSSTQIMASDGSVRKTKIDVKDSTGYEIQGGHIFYPVPLGNPGADDALHSLLRIYTVVPHELMAKSAAARKLLRIEQQPIKLPEGETSYNNSKISVKFNGASSTIAKLVTNAINKVATDSQQKIVANALANDGTKFTVEFKSWTGIGPGEVASAFSTALNSLLPKKSTENNYPQLPQVTIEGMTTYIK